MYILKNTDHISLPYGARALIEHVYENGNTTVPDALTKRDLRAEGEFKAAIAMANLNSLNAWEGYASTMQWADEVLTPTRIQDPTVTLRLAVFSPTQQILPWAQTTWENTEVQVSSRLVHGNVEQSDVAMTEPYRNAYDSMPDRGRWSILVVLSPTDNASWRGYVIDKNGQQIVVDYNATTGLHIEKENG